MKCGMQAGIKPADWCGFSRRQPSLGFAREENCAAMFCRGTMNGKVLFVDRAAKSLGGLVDGFLFLLYNQNSSEQTRGRSAAYVTAFVNITETKLSFLPVDLHVFPKSKQQGSSSL